ncbi:MAG: phosphoribosylglycinamide formyltransferase [Vicinamibacterales bacterium]
MENRPVPLAVLISGRGSNLAAIMRAASEGRLPGGRLDLVVSNRAEAGGLALAREAGIETLVLSQRAAPSREAYDSLLAETLRARGIGFVCLAGFMRLLGPAFCAAFPDAILNIHPSLLPAFPGLDAQRQALEHGVGVSGATVHFVTPELDAGPIVMQRAVEVRDHDDVASLSARILAVEHEIYPAAIARVLAGGWRIDGRRVRWESRAD